MVIAGSLGERALLFQDGENAHGLWGWKKKHQGIDRVVSLVHFLHHFLFFHPGPGDALLELARIKTTQEATLSATVEGKKITLPP